jgi:hypothetical protein
MTVTVDAYFPQRTCLFEGLVYAFEQGFTGLDVTIAQYIRQQGAGQHLVARIDAQPLDTKPRAAPERTQGTNLMHARETPSQKLSSIGRVELGRAAAHPRKSREAEVAIGEKRAPLHHDRCRHGKLCSGHLRRELVLFTNLLVRPALRPIEFQHQAAARAAQLVDAIFVAVQGKKPAIHIEANRGGRIEHNVGREAGERLHIRRIAFVYHHFT